MQVDATNKRKVGVEEALPDELMVVVFSHLKTQRDVNAVKQVCHRWRFLVNENEVLRPLWEKKKITCPSLRVPPRYFSEFEVFYRKAYSLQGRIEPFLKENEPFLSKLHLLIVAPFAQLGSQELLCGFQYIATHCPKLEAVDLRRCEMIDERVMIVGVALFNRECRNLSIVHSSPFTQPPLIKILKHFQYLKSV